MKAAVLFAGIGGWEIACEMNGVDVVWACEWDDWKRARYLERWPHAHLYGDVEQIDGRRLRQTHGPIDILLGSPPCTDISAANPTGQGIDGAQSRYYLEAIRLTRESGARWCGFENSPRLRSRGADRVLHEMDAAGYTCWPSVVAAEDCGAPHERARSFVIGCRRDALEGADAERQRVWLKQGWRRWSDGASAAEPATYDPDTASVERREIRNVETAASGNPQALSGRRTAPGLNADSWRTGVDESAGQQCGDSAPPTPCHSDCPGLAEWQGVGGNPLAQLTPAQRAALCPWDHRGDGLAWHLSVAHELASRLRGHGLSERATKTELARWRSALGDALVIPVVWAVVRGIIRTDEQMGTNTNDG